MSANGRLVYTALFHPPSGKARILGVFSTRAAAVHWLFMRTARDDAKYHTVENHRVNEPTMPQHPKREAASAYS